MNKKDCKLQLTIAYSLTIKPYLINPFVFNQIYTFRIYKRRSISKTIKISFGYFAKDSTHDFSRASFWKPCHKLNFIEFSNWSDVGRNVLVDLVTQIGLISGFSSLF